MLKSTV